MTIQFVRPCEPQLEPVLVQFNTESVVGGFNDLHADLFDVKGRLLARQTQVVRTGLKAPADTSKL